MTTFLLLTITGFGLGAMYYLIASGLSLIYGLMGVLNFAHGAFITVGAYGASYFALIATGRNTLYFHYHKNTAALQAGDLVQFDYAPDHKYYSSDVTRVFPANGKFTARQQELYDVVLGAEKAVLAAIKPGMVLRGTGPNSLTRIAQDYIQLCYGIPRLRSE